MSPHIFHSENYSRHIDRVEIGKDFDSADRVVIFMMSNDLRSVLMGQRASGRWACPSGEEPLHTMHPDAAARIEANHEAGHKDEQDIEVTRFCTFTFHTLGNSTKVATYGVVLSPDLKLKPKKPDRDPLTYRELVTLKQDEFEFPDQVLMLQTFLKNRYSIDW